jgi:hypothetical protein
MAEVTAARLKVDVTTNAGKATSQLKGLDRQLDTSSKKTKKLSSNNKTLSRSFDMLKVSILSVGAVAIAAYARFSKDAVRASSALEEETSKFNTVFGKLSKEMGQEVKALQSIYAMSEREAKKYLSSMQDLLVPMGMAPEHAKDFSKAIVRLSADLGSFNNMKTEDVMRDLQSAMVGNFETTKKYGVILNETTIKQEAMRLGLMKVGDTLSAANKAQAAYNILVRSTKAAQGDMIRTSASYANSMKRLNATLENFKAQFGNETKKGVTQVANALNFVMQEGHGVGDVFLWIGKIGSSVFKQIALFILDTNAALLSLKATGEGTVLDAFRTNAQLAKELSEILKKNNKDEKMFFADSQDHFNARAVQLKKQLLLQTKIGETSARAFKLRGKKIGFALSDEFPSQMGLYSVMIDGVKSRLIVTGEQMKKFNKEAGNFDFGSPNIKKYKNLLAKLRGGVDGLTQALKIMAAAGSFAATKVLAERGFKNQLETINKYKSALKKLGVDTVNFEKFVGQKRLEVINNFLRKSASNQNESIEKRKQGLIASYNEILKTQGLSQQELLAAQKQYNEQMALLNQERYQQINKEMEFWGSQARGVIGIFESITQAINNNAQAQINAIKKANDEEIRSMEKAGATTEEVAKRRAELEEQLEQKRSALAKRQARQQKAFGIAQALINTALGISKAFASYIWPYSAIVAGIVGAAGAAQVAAIASVPTPAQFGGSFIVPPGNQADSGLMAVNSGEQVDVTPVRETGKENNRPQILMIDGKQFKGYVYDTVNQGFSSGKIYTNRKGTVRKAL